MALFALITWQVTEEGPLVRLDERVGGSLFGRGPAALSQLFSDLGAVPVALPVLVCAIVYALWCGARRPPVYAALTMAAVPALVIPLKVATARQGPLTEAVNYYPSGHTATAAVAYGASALLLMALPRPAWLRAWVPPAAAVLLTTATGVGLVLHGYHWPLDVLASWCLGPVLLAPLWWVARRRRGEPPAAGAVATRAPAAGHGICGEVSCRNRDPACPWPSATDCGVRRCCRRGRGNAW